MNVFRCCGHLISIPLLLFGVSCADPNNSAAPKASVVVDKYRQEKVGLQQLIWLDVSAKASGYSDVLERIEKAKRRVAADESGASFSIAAIGFPSADNSLSISVYLYCASDDVASIRFLDGNRVSLAEGVLPTQALPEHGAKVPCQAVIVKVISTSGVPKSGFVNVNEVEVKGSADQIAFVDIRLINGESGGVVDVIPQAKFLLK